MSETIHIAGYGTVPAMVERGLILSAPMVLATLDGRKTQSRRERGFKTLNDPNNGEGGPGRARLVRVRNGVATFGDSIPDDPCPMHYKCPYGKPGDLLWVREKLLLDGQNVWRYAADRKPVRVARRDRAAMVAWAHHREHDTCSPIYMPRWASRITLELTRVRVQRVQQITKRDVIAEGVLLPMAADYWDKTTGQYKPCPPGKGVPLINVLSPHLAELPKGKKLTLTDYYRCAFAFGWDEINGDGAWHRNGWVWVLNFRRLL